MNYSISQYLRLVCDTIIYKLSRISNTNYYFVLLALASTTVSLFFGFPSYEQLDRKGYQEVWEIRQEQIKAPFQAQEYKDVSSHEAKLAFRFSIPLVLHLFNLPLQFSHFIHYIFLILLFYWLSKLTYKITNDRILAAIIALTFSFVYVGNILVTDIRGNFDVVAYALIALIMLSRNPAIIIIALLGAGFTDERGLIATGIVIIFHFVHEREYKDWNIKGIIKQYKPLLSIICGWLIYFAIRWGLQHYNGLHTPAAGTNLLAEQGNMWAFGVWSGLEGLWLPILLSLIPLFKVRAHLLASIYIVAMLVVIMIALSVADITRSMCYVFPAFFIGLSILKRFEQQTWLRYFFMLVFIISLIPTYYASGDKMVIMVKPLPLQLLRWLYL